MKSTHWSWTMTPFDKMKKLGRAVRLREIDLLGLQARYVGEDGLTPGERRAVDAIVETLGYANVEIMAHDNGFASPREMAHNHSFKNTRDYFLGQGWSDRLGPYARRNGNGDTP